jgi:hypothetical protein
MGMVVRLETVHQHGEAERWRRRGYEAVDQTVEKLRDEIGEKDFEELSALLGWEGRQLTGALFEEVNMQKKHLFAFWNIKITSGS